MAHPTSNQDSVAVRAAPVPRLECMPDVVIDRITELLLFRTASERQHDELERKRALSFEIGRLAVLYLSLAAPNLYAPCLHAVIRTTTQYHPAPLLFWNRNNGTVPLHLMGTFVQTITIGLDEFLEPIRWFLVLPPRAENRSYVGPSALAVLHEHFRVEFPVPRLGGNSGIPVFLPWTLLPVGSEQRRYCQSTEQDRVIPSQCYELVVENSLRGVVVPASLVRLDLLDVILPLSAGIPAIFQQLCNLRSLALLDVTSPAKDETAFATLAAHVPISVTELALRQTRAMFTESDVQALADRIQHALTELKSLTVYRCHLALLARMVAALPRTGMRKLGIEALIKDEQDFVQCSKLLANTAPSGSVRALRLSVVPDSDHYGHLTANNTVPVLLARLPRATHFLQVSTKEIRWTVEACQTLPLAPTLTQLSLDAGSEDDEMALEQLMRRLPASLTDLSLRAWVFRQTPSAAIVGAHLPPNLIALRLTQCDLTENDLATFVWPKSLRHLDLEGNHLMTVPAAALPAQLQTLGLHDSSYLSDNGTVEWVTALPTTLRAINIAGTPLGDKFVAELLQRMPTPRATAAPRMIFVNNAALSCKGKEELAAKFTVIDALVPF